MAKTVMLVDDEKDVRDTVTSILEKEGYKVVLAKDSNDFVAKVKKMKKKPDLVLLDIMMPGIHVRDAIKKVKGLRIVFFTVVNTTDAEKEDLMESKQVVGFIQKPFDLDKFVKKVKKLTG